MKKNIKGILKLFCLLFAFALTGCGKKEIREIGKISEPEKIVYYTIGAPDEDLGDVTEALNKLLSERYNLTVDYRKVSWDEYDSKVSALIKSDSEFDVLFAAGIGQGDYAGWAKKGVWLDLSEFLQNGGEELYREISPLFWEGVTVDGKIYGIPTNKEVAVPEYFMFPKEIVEKYNIDIESINDLNDLEPYLEIISKEEPEYLPLELDRYSNNFFSIYGYEYVLSREVPLAVKSFDEEHKVVNIFETEDARTILDSLRKYYLAGYINADAPIRRNATLEKGKKVFCKMASGGPYSETSWSNDRGYDIVSSRVGVSVATTESTRGAVMVINANTKKVDACYRFLKALNTDSDVRNLINYGIENRHYILDANEQVTTISDTYSGVQYTQGNWFILNTRTGEPKNKWEIYRQFNDEAKASNMLGFQADTAKIEKEISAVKEVWSMYYPALMTGSVDVEKYLREFIEALNAAGLETIESELQGQIDSWNRQH